MLISQDENMMPIDPMTGTIWVNCKSYFPTTIFKKLSLTSKNFQNHSLNPFFLEISCILSDKSIP